MRVVTQHPPGPNDSDDLFVPEQIEDDSTEDNKDGDGKKRDGSQITKREGTNLNDAIMEDDNSEPSNQKKPCSSPLNLGSGSAIGLVEEAGGPDGSSATNH